MATVEDIVKDISAISPNDIPAVAVARWIDNRYRELVSKVQFQHLRETKELVLPATITSGTVTATRGSTTVTGTDTTWATDPGVGNNVHHYFRIREAWYKIETINSDTSITLSQAYSEENVVNSNYAIAKRTHALNSSVRWLGEFIFPRLRYNLTRMSLAELEVTYPGRHQDQMFPTCWAQQGVDSNGTVVIEIYPAPKEAELIKYTYWSIPNRLTFLGTIPNQIDPYVIKEGALIDLYRYLKVLNLQNGSVEVGSLYMKSEIDQQKIWNKAILDAVRTQKAANDVSFALKYWQQRDRTDIRTAQDQIYSTWIR